MQRLIYTSIARRQMSQRDIDRILMTSRLYNEISGITGLLVYHEKRFLQVLEGPIVELDKVYDRIRRDYRGTRIAVCCLKKRLSRVRLINGRWRIATMLT